MDRTTLSSGVWTMLVPTTPAPHGEVERQQAENDHRGDEDGQ